MRFLKSTRVRIVAAVVVVVVVVFGIMTTVLFVYPDLNAPEHSDAIVVLGGHGVPAFDKGVALAKQGYAPNLILSLQNWQSCPPYQAYLAVNLPHVQVQCFKANPQTTQGEARSIEALAKQHHWQRVLVVVPTTQASRARLRIGRCYPGQVLEVAYSPGNVGQWLVQFAYEWGAMFKAVVLQPSC
ncbi:MAG TPA: hypothetical protein VG244_14095 [Acidimicrobiales bacterium]|jgi:uncharacterized SAM-binding protein YcdF (DUF218 family)|nr:hypothetical protein [Acidimicrobiales bacterium]